ncbi:hypothetical protein HGRIS_005500 [Hohenbuehelia grisea]|uniref:TNT domain-containing protein n=1 Tax=Hohenbuehelia grisea TaxID=104357 RepID=A0ABR3JY05_9AGAR
MYALAVGSFLAAFLAVASASPITSSHEELGELGTPYSSQRALLAPSYLTKCGEPGSVQYCAGTNRTSGDWFLCQDERLGPVTLPHTLPLSNLVVDYDRFGGLCPGEFLAKWTDKTTGFYVWPPLEGFQLNTAKERIAGNQTLLVGMRLDRFGHEGGKYLAPAWTPFAQRSISPKSLEIPDDPRLTNYRQYVVLKEFDVLSGPIAPWFGQPGQGTQYQTHVTVAQLLSDKFLQRLPQTEY